MTNDFNEEKQAKANKKCDKSHQKNKNKKD